MSTYGEQPQQPQDPYSQPGQQPGPSPYVQQPGYGQPNPYGGGGYDYGQQQAYGAGSYAHWGKRVGAVLVDGLLTMLAALPAIIGWGILVASAETRTSPNGVQSVEMSGGALPTILILLGFLTYLAFYVWNLFIRQGRTGQTIGKSVLGIRLIGESTGQPVGAGMCFVRQIAHVLDGFCFIGYLWPLWDDKRQTFADKILSTVVIDQPKH